MTPWVNATPIFKHHLSIMFCTSTFGCNSDMHCKLIFPSVWSGKVWLFSSKKKKKKDIKFNFTQLIWNNLFASFFKKKRLEKESSVLATYYLCNCCRARTFPGPLPFWVGTHCGHPSGFPVSVLWGFARSTRPSCPQRPPPRRRRCSQNSISNSTARAANIFRLPCLNPKIVV